MTSNTTIRLFALVLVVTLGLTLLPSVAFADTTDSHSPDGESVCSVVTGSLTETRDETDLASDSDGVVAPTDGFRQASEPTGEASLPAKPPEYGGSGGSYVADDGLEGPPYSAKQWIEAGGVPPSPESTGSTNEAYVDSGLRPAPLVDPGAGPVDSAVEDSQIPPAGTVFQQHGGADSSERSGPTDPAQSLPIVLFLTGAGIAAAMLTASHSPWRGREMASLVTRPRTRSRVVSTLRSVREAGTLIAEQGRIATTRVLERGTASPAPVGHAGAARPTAAGSTGPDEQAPDFTIDEVDLLPDDAYVETILDDNDGRMKQSQIVESTDWSKAKVSRLLSTMDDDGTIVKIQLGRENLICLEGQEPEILAGPDRP